MSEVGAELPGVPIDHAADALLNVNPELGAVIVLLSAGFVGYFIWSTRTMGRKDKELLEAGAAISAAKDQHIAGLEKSIEVVRDLRETVLAEMARRRRS